MMTQMAREVWISNDGTAAWHIHEKGWQTIKVNLTPKVKPGAILRRKKLPGKGMSGGCGPGRPLICTNGAARQATPNEVEILRKLFAQTGAPFQD